MAERRMFAKSIMMSDRFMDLSAEAKVLYVGLCLSADDEGFTDTTRSVMTLLGCKNSAFNSLVKAGYVIKLSKDVSLIVHWNIHNSIRKDRKKESKFYEMKKLVAENPDGTYVLLNDLVDVRLTDDGHTGDKCPHSIGEYSIGKDRLVKGSVGKKESLPDADMAFNENGNEASFHSDTPTLKEIKDYCQRESLVYVNSEIFFNHYDAFSWRYPDGTRITNWQALLKKWNAQDREKKGHMGRETFYGDSLYVDTSELEA